ERPRHPRQRTCAVARNLQNPPRDPLRRLADDRSFQPHTDRARGGDARVARLFPDHRRGLRARAAIHQDAVERGGKVKALLLAMMLGSLAPTASAADKKHIVFLTGDEEYRSEEGLPMLAKILAER